MTGALLNINIRGRGGLSLKEKWSEGPRTYLGLTIAGFPNFFAITGPGSPSVLSNMIVSIEQYVDWIAGCLADLRAHGHAAIEATPEAEAA
jgi:cyclohexanone monooxygenase